MRRNGIGWTAAPSFDDDRVRRKQRCRDRWDASRHPSPIL